MALEEVGVRFVAKACVNQLGCDYAAGSRRSTEAQDARIKKGEEKQRRYKVLARATGQGAALVRGASIRLSCTARRCRACRTPSLSK